MLVEELRSLRADVVAAEGEDVGEAVVHLLAFGVDKLINYSSRTNVWHALRGTIANVFSKHDYSFKATFAEMAACAAGSGLTWAIDNVLDAYEKLAALPRAESAGPARTTSGSGVSLLSVEDGSLPAVVMDPPYSDNVQYAELADFFYVWLKRTQGHRRPEWFSQYLCETGEEAVVNVSRHRGNGKLSAGEARRRSEERYERLMTETFCECCRVLRDDGVLTVMFTHKKQQAWEALFQSLISAGFTITATWPVQTESQHSLHQARKNAAQSTVVLVARKRQEDAGRGYFDDAMRAEIREVARETAARLRDEGLNPVDQLVGAFGPAMEVFSRYAQVTTDTGEPVRVGEAIQTAADAVAEWRVEQLAQRGIEGVDEESRFVLLCWDVLQAAEFRFNEAMLLGKSVGMDVDRLKRAGLLTSSGDKVKLLPAKDRRRERPVSTEQEQQQALFETNGGRRRRRPSRNVHPNDQYFASAIDACHALALRYSEAGGGQAGIGAVRGIANQQGWHADSPCARLMSALVNAAPEAVRFPGKGKTKTAADEFPEFRAWHAMLKELFSIEPPEWVEPQVEQPELLSDEEEDEEEVDDTEGD